MKLRYCVIVITTSGRVYQSPEHQVEGAQDVAEQRLREAVEKQVAETWAGGGGLFDLGAVVNHPGDVSINRAHIEAIEVIFQPPDTETPPTAVVGGVDPDYAASAE